MIYGNVLRLVLIELGFWTVITFMALLLALGSKDLTALAVGEFKQPEYLEGPPFGSQDEDK